MSGGRGPVSAAPAFLPAAASQAALPEVAGDAALILVIGGLAMTLSVTLLIVLQNLLPERAGRRLPGGPDAGRELRPVEASLLPPVAASGLRRRGGYAVPLVDRVMDAVVELRLGEPRLLRALPEASIVRLYGCRACADHRPGDPAGDGCADAAKTLAHLFGQVLGRGVVVQETHCRRRGAASCEFEVRH